MNTKQTGLECNFRGQVIPVTKDSNEFVRVVRDEMRPYGLQISMADFVEVYGELMHSSSRTGRSNPFHISAAEGPCRVICANCEVELDEPTIAALGTNSAMAAFGLPPVIKCPECGNPKAVIVSA
jgi:hypothetical protein